MKEPVKQTMQELRKNLNWEIVAAVTHHAWTVRHSYADIFEAARQSLWEPILESVQSHTEHFLTDVLIEYDTVRKKISEISELVDEPQIVHMLGIRGMGIDHPEYIHSGYEQKELRYAEIFCIEVGMSEEYEEMVPSIRLLKSKNPSIYDRRGTLRHARNPWPRYLLYLRDWSEKHYMSEYKGMSPASYEDWHSSIWKAAMKTES